LPKIDAATCPAEICQPTLIITGCLDPLTPAYHSYEMARRIPNSTLLCKTLGSHFVMLECAPPFTRTRVPSYH
jgi:pimeloyl-ACP methyl ester carboxylesterase